MYQATLKYFNNIKPVVSNIQKPNYANFSLLKWEDSQENLIFSMYSRTLTSFNSKLLPLAGNSLPRFYENHKEFPLLPAESLMSLTLVLTLSLEEISIKDM